MKSGRDYPIDGEPDRTRKLSLDKLKSLVAKDLQLAIRLEAADENGNCQCVTCGTVKRFTEMHVGNFISGRTNAGRTNAILFDERNIHPQCNRCNTYLGGNQEMYSRFMVEKYGQEVVDELRRLRHTVKKIYRVDLLEMRTEYKERIRHATRS